MMWLLLACTLQPDDVCFSPGKCDERLIDLIEGAQRTIDVAIYSLNRKSIASALAKAAIARGVKVRVLLDRLQSGNEHEKSALRVLANALVPTKAAHHKGIMHMKLAIIDGRYFVHGSYNWTDPATTDNDEVVSFADCPDLALRGAAEFESRWEAGR